MPGDIKSDAAATRHHGSERHDAHAQESESGGFGNGCDSDSREGRCPVIFRITGIVSDLEIAPQRGGLGDGAADAYTSA